MVKITISEYAQLENTVEALNLKADAYIMKLVKLEKLLALIEGRNWEERAKLRR